MHDSAHAFGDVGFAKPAQHLRRNPAAMPARARGRELGAERGPILTAGHDFVRAPRGKPDRLRETRRREAQGEERRDARFAEAFARHVAPDVDAFRDVDERLEPPPHRHLAVAEVFQ